jgi:hypothetical protein
MEGLERIVSEHRLFQGLGPEFVNLAAGCAKNVRFNADQIFSTRRIRPIGSIWSGTAA